ncbi:hypothetical protein YX04_000893 [Salmonella enterica subsp. enterica]|nr:hypothetical protein [Salmonella enterica]EDT6462949.1 hypothetical protein [Salmonella enterica subsp. enterica]
MAEKGVSESCYALAQLNWLVQSCGFRASLSRYFAVKVTHRAGAVFENYDSGAGLRSRDSKA